MTRGYRTARINTATTTHLYVGPCFVQQIVISVEAAGTSFKFRLQDQSSPPMVLISETTLSAPSSPTAAIVRFEDPVFMKGGVDAVTTGTPGAVCIWIDGWIPDA